MVVLVGLATLVALGACGGDDGDGLDRSSGGGSGGGDEPAAEPGGPAATTADGQVRYMAIGDSLSQGEGAVDEATGSFPARLAEDWRGSGCDVELLDAGISGYTAGQMLAEQVPQISDFAPTIVTFQSGGNDIVNAVTADQYRSDVQGVLDAIVDSGAQIVVLAQNDWYRSPLIADGSYGDVDLFAEQRAEFDEILLAEAAERDATFVDLRAINEQAADDGLWVADGIHPTEDVYAEWATTIADQVPCSS